MGDFNYQPPSTGELIAGFLHLVGFHRSRLDPSTNLGLLQRFGGGKVGDALGDRERVFFFFVPQSKVRGDVFFWG